MTNSYNDVVYVATSNILKAAQNAFAPGSLSSFRTGVSHDSPPSDCNLLIATADNLDVQFGYLDPHSGGDAGVYVYTADVLVAYRLCAPVLSKQGEAPPMEQEDSYAHDTFVASWAIIRSIVQARRKGELIPNGECSFSSPPIGKSIPVQGGFGGWDIIMTIEIAVA